MKKYNLLYVVISVAVLITFISFGIVFAQQPICINSSGHLIWPNQNQSVNYFPIADSVLGQLKKSIMFQSGNRISIGIATQGTATQGAGLFVQGGTAGLLPLDIRGEGLPWSGINNVTASLLDTRPLAKDIGGSLVLGGTYNSAGATTHWAAIKSGKDNANDGDFGGYLSFWTHANANELERIRILSSGNVGIGITAPSEKLEVAGNIKATKDIIAGERLCIGTDCRASWGTTKGPQQSGWAIDDTYTNITKTTTGINKVQIKNDGNLILEISEE